MSDEKDLESSQSDGMVNEGAPDNEGPKLSYEELQAELSKTRREAAERRIKNRDAEKELDEYRKWKESQMSETQKAQARLAEIEAERIADYTEIAQSKFGLEDDDLEFLKGSTKAEILASAEKLASRLGRGKSTAETEEVKSNPNLFPGTRGTPVGSGKSDYNDLLRRQLAGER
jgi:hypothetical protein